MDRDPMNQTAAEVAARLEEERVLEGAPDECTCMETDSELCDVCRQEDSELLHGFRD